MIAPILIVVSVVLLARLARAAVAAWVDPTALLTPQPALARVPTRPCRSA